MEDNKNVMPEEIDNELLEDVSGGDFCTTVTAILSADRYHTYFKFVSTGKYTQEELDEFFRIYDEYTYKMATIGGLTPEDAAEFERIYSEFESKQYSAT